jgi:hypothetical protein
MLMAQRYEARVLDRDTYRRTVPQIDINWRTSNLMYQQSGFRPQSDVPDSGRLLVQSPYTSQFDVTWGLTPISDQVKYRWLYRARTEVRRAIDIKTTFALGRGFRVICQDNPKVEQYSNDLINRLNMREVGPLLLNNKLVYGQCYAEKIRAGKSEIMNTETLESQPVSVSAKYDVDAEMKSIVDWSRARFSNKAATEPYTNAMARMLEETTSRFEATINERDKIVAERNIRFGFSDPIEPDRVSVKCALSFEETGKTIKSDISVPVHATSRSKFVFDATTKKTKTKQSFGNNTTGSDALGTPSGLVFQYADRDNEKDFDMSGELIALKVVDPLYMQIQRHPLDIIVGFIQWTVNAVPQTVMPEEMVYMRNMPNSWIYESAYGTSILMPITHHISMLIQAEEDLKIWHHMYAKPFRVLYVGEKGKPYTLGSAKINNYVGIMGNIQPNQDLVLPGECELEFPLSNFNPDQTSAAWINYLNSKVYEGVGIPGVLANRTSGTSTSGGSSGNRAKSDDEMSSFIAEEIMQQQMFGEDFLKQVLIPELIRVFGRQLPEIQLVFPPILDEDWNKKCERVIKMAGRPFVSPNESRRLMNMKVVDKKDPMYDESLDKIPEGASAGFGQLSKPEQSESQKTGKREEGLQKRNRNNPSAD